MSFKDILGQEQIVSHMKNAIGSGNVSHAYIISGEKGSGKKMIAKTFAAAILCESGQDEPCMQCRSCRQILGDNNPDLKYITHEKPGLISVNEIREQLNNDISVKPYSRPKKIYIIDEAEKMNEQAQNALLKTIEEPPEYAVIMLLTVNEKMFLQTILSRCIRLQMKPVAKKDIIKLLVDKHGASYELAETAASFADGVCGKAIDYIENEKFTDMKREIIKLVTRIGRMDAGQIHTQVKAWKEAKDELLDRISLLEIWYRDVLVAKTAGAEDMLFFKDEATDVFGAATDLSVRGITKKTEAIKLFKNRMNANVNMEAALFLMFLSLKDTEPERNT